MKKSTIAVALLALGGAAATITPAQAAPTATTTAAVVNAAVLNGDAGAHQHRWAPQTRLPRGFTEQQQQVGEGVTLNYVRGGSGPTLVLLHGYPETWWMWRDVLGELAEHYTVIAPDLRGSGRSSAPAHGYDKATLAADVHRLLQKLGLDTDIRLVGHDIGTQVAYAYAAAHRDDVERVVLSEAPIPDERVYSYPALSPMGPAFWNFGFFNVTNGLVEQTIDGRERVWVDRFTDSAEVQKDGVDDRDVREYARWLRDDAHLKASFEYFRAFDEDIAAAPGYAENPLPMPVLALGGERGLGLGVAESFRPYASNLSTAIIADSGHWIFEEQPAASAAEVLRFLDTPAGSGR